MPIGVARLFLGTLNDAQAVTTGVARTDNLSTRVTGVSPSKEI